MLANYEAKQACIGKTFDFWVDDDSEIHLVMYHDNPSVSLIVIPDFVSYIDSSNLLTSMFKVCSGSKKIVAHANLKGSLAFLFHECKLDSLDLTEFDTTNIQDMHNMFSSSTIYNLILGKRFNTCNVRDMTSMFRGFQTKDLSLDIAVDSCKYMKEMFSECWAETINLGKRFNVHNVTNMKKMFYRCRTYNLQLGDKFNTCNVDDMSSMFEGAKLGSGLDLRQLSTKSAIDLTRMFFGSTIYGKITIGRKFNMIKHVSYRDMLFGISAECIEIEGHVNITTIARMNEFSKYVCIIQTGD